MRKTSLSPFRLRRDNSGVALLEFALAFPLLLLLSLGGLELTNYLLAQMHVNRIAVMTADNASRLRTQMSESYVNQLFVGARKAGESIDFQNRGRVVLSSVQNNVAGNGQWIRWQRCTGSLSVASKYGLQDKGKNDNSLPSLNNLQAQAGSAMMFVEVSYDYRPLFDISLFPVRRLTRDAAFIVRQRTDFSIAGSNPSTCT
jgi:hypothetical protein